MIRRYPSIIALIFVSTGILIADQSRLASWIFLASCLLCCVAGFLTLERRAHASATVLFGMVLFFFSAFHFAWEYYDAGPNHVSKLDCLDRRLHIFGRVSDWPDLRSDRTDFKIELDSVAHYAARRVDGSILLRISDTTTAFQRGDRVEFYGRIYPVKEAGPVSGSDYRRYLNLKGVYGVVYMPTTLDVRLDRRNRYALVPLADLLRGAIRNSLRRNLSADAAALATGILIGETRDIPVDTYLRFRDSGTLHLLAVSGSNVALVVLFFVVLLKPLRLKPISRLLILLSVILVFTLLSYGEPSVVRASVMAGLVLFAGLIQRKYNLNNIIAVTACFILLFEPVHLFDIGFQLSFTIAWGLIFILPRITALFRPVYHRWWYRWLIFPFLVSLLAQVCSAGLIAFHFGRVPLISPIANLVIVPLVSIAVVGSLILLLSDLVLPLLGAFMGAWFNLLLELILDLVILLGDERIPALTVADLSIWPVAVFYLYLFLAAWSLRHKFMRRILLIVLVLMANLALSTMLLPARQSGASAQVHLFAVPGGIAAVIRAPESVTADLVVTGLSGKTYPIDERVIGPQLSRLGVTGLNSLFVLSGAYDAIDDLLRLSHTYQSDRIYVDMRLGPSFRDVVNIMGDSSAPVQAVSFTQVGLPADVPDRYFCGSACGLVFVSGGSKVVFADRVVAEHFGPQAGTQETCLVIGSSWRTSLSDLERLRRNGFCKIYCSKMEQRVGGERSLGTVRAPLTLPPYIYDLGRCGSVTLDL